MVLSLVAGLVSDAVEALVAPPQEAVLTLHGDGEGECSTSAQAASALW
jgi:hypothetical protein